MDLVTFTGEILNEKLNFLYSVYKFFPYIYIWKKKNIIKLVLLYVAFVKQRLVFTVIFFCLNHETFFRD